MHLRLISILCLLALGSTLSTIEAQGRHRPRPTRTNFNEAEQVNPQFIDLYFFSLHSPEPGELPKIEALGSRRYGPFPARGKTGQVKSSKRLGNSIPGLKRLRVSPQYDDRIEFAYSYKSRNFRMSGTRFHALGDVAVLGHGHNRPTIRIAIRGVPQGEDPEELALWSNEDLAEFIGRRVLSVSGEKATGVLSTFIHLPMQQLLPLPMVVQLRERLASPDWNSKPLNDNLSSWQLSADDVRTAARIAIGDPEATRGPFQYNWDQEPFRKVLMTAYAQSEVPEQRGKIGWFLTRPYGDQHQRPVMAAFVEPFYRDIESGKAVLLGPSDEVALRRTYLQRLAEETQILLPLLVLAGAALALFAVCMAARRMARLGA